MDPNGDNKLEEIQSIARGLAKDIILYITGNGPSAPPPNRHAETLRKTVKSFLSDHRRFLTFVVDMVEPQNLCAFVKILENMFTDKVINWGRLVSVYSFAAKIGESAMMKELGDEHLHNIIELLGSYVAHKLGQWIERQGGWDAFDNYFQAAGGARRMTEQHDDARA